MVRQIQDIIKDSAIHRHYRNLATGPEPARLWDGAPLNEVGTRAVELLDAYLPKDYELGQFVALDSRGRKISVKNLMRAAMIGPSRWHGPDRIGMAKPPDRDQSLQGVYRALKQVKEIREHQDEYCEQVTKISRMKKSFFRMNFPTLTGSARQLKIREAEAKKIREKIEEFPVSMRVLATAMDAAELEHIFSVTTDAERRRHSLRILNFGGPLLRAFHRKDQETDFEKLANEVETRALPIVSKDEFRKTQAEAYPIVSALNRDKALLDAAFREAIKRVQTDSKIHARVKSMAAIHRKWWEPPSETAQSGREKYKTVADMPDLYGNSIVVPGANGTECMRISLGIAGQMHGRLLSEIAPEALKVKPEDDTETAAAKARVGLLKVKNADIRKNYYLERQSRPNQYKAVHMGVELEDDQHKREQFGALRDLEFQVVDAEQDKLNQRGAAGRDVYKTGTPFRGVFSFLDEGQKTRTISVNVNPPNQRARAVEVDHGAIVFDLLNVLKDTGISDEDILENRVNVTRGTTEENAKEMNLFDSVPAHTSKDKEHVFVRINPESTKTPLTTDTLKTLLEKASHLTTKDYIREVLMNKAAKPTGKG